MLSIALEYQIVFEWLAIKEKLSAPFQPNKDDWNFAREICARLKSSMMQLNYCQAPIMSQ
jgi:hypothetical protein